MSFFTTQNEYILKLKTGMKCSDRIIVVINQLTAMTNTAKFGQNYFMVYLYWTGNQYQCENRILRNNFHMQLS